MSPEVRQEALRSVMLAADAAWARARSTAAAAFADLHDADLLNSHDARTEFQVNASAALDGAQELVNAINGCLAVIDELERGVVTPRPDARQ